MMVVAKQTRSVTVLFSGSMSWSCLTQLQLRRCHSLSLTDFCDALPMLSALEILHLEDMFAGPPKGCCRFAEKSSIDVNQHCIFFFAMVIVKWILKNVFRTSMFWLLFLSFHVCFAQVIWHVFFTLEYMPKSTALNSLVRFICSPGASFVEN
jgi:hypothetical protein